MMLRCTALLFLVILSGCKNEEVQTVDYYLENHIKRAERLKACELQDNAEADANCVNARAAQEQIKIGDTKNDWLEQIEPQNPAPAE